MENAIDFVSKQELQYLRKWPDPILRVMKNDEARSSDIFFGGLRDAVQGVFEC
jgi:hypothetical protein